MKSVAYQSLIRHGGRLNGYTTDRRQTLDAARTTVPQTHSGPRGGQPPKSDRVRLSGILFVLKTGIPFEDFSQEMGCSGMTLRNRLRQWNLPIDIASGGA